jgi:hypothetical protein
VRIVLPTVAATAAALITGAAVTLTPTPTAGEGVLFIAPGGSDTGPCTERAPCATFVRALQSGRTFLARGGTYPADEDLTVADGSRLLAYPGETPVHTGRFWVSGGQGWELGGLSFTWGPDSTGEDHLTAADPLVKVTGGVGWQIHDSDISGAKSWTTVLITGDPVRWRFERNRVHGNAGYLGHDVVVDSGSSVSVSGAGDTPCPVLLDTNPGEC